MTRATRPHVVALLSGGKDSCFNIMECEANGYEVIVLANLMPTPANTEEAPIHEIDSFMYQTASHNMIQTIADAMELPLERRAIRGKYKAKGLTYTQTENDEVEDLFELLKQVVKKYPTVEAVSCGAILSNYQRNRVEDVCNRLGLKSLSFMWQREQGSLLREMVHRGVRFHHEFLNLFIFSYAILYLTFFLANFEFNFFHNIG